MRWDSGLLFERFMSPERDGPPDIDIDIESDRREEVIQYVYERHGRSHAAQVANVITYRARSAVRDAAKALGFAPGQQDAFSKAVGRWGGVPDPASVLEADSGGRGRSGRECREGQHRSSRPRVRARRSSRTCPVTSGSIREAW